MVPPATETSRGSYKKKPATRPNPTIRASSSLFSAIAICSAATIATVNKLKSIAMPRRRRENRAYLGASALASGTPALTAMVPSPITGCCCPGSLQCKSSVGDDGLARRESRLVRGQIHGDGGHLLGGAEAAHGLAGDEHGAGLVGAADLAAEGGDAVVEGGRLDGAGADAVAAHPLADEVHRHRLGQADDGGLGRPVDVAVGRGPHGAHRRGDADDGAAALGQHARQERLDSAVDRLDVEVEGEVPILLRAVEHRAVMDEAGGVEQHI